MQMATVFASASGAVVRGVQQRNFRQLYSPVSVNGPDLRRVWPDRLVHAGGERPSPSRAGSGRMTLPIECYYLTASPNSKQTTCFLSRSKSRPLARIGGTEEVMPTLARVLDTVRCRPRADAALPCRPSSGDCRSPCRPTRRTIRPRPERSSALPGFAVHAMQPSPGIDVLEIMKKWPSGPGTSEE